MLPTMVPHFILHLLFAFTQAAHYCNVCTPRCREANSGVNLIKSVFTGIFSVSIYRHENYHQLVLACPKTEIKQSVAKTKMEVESDVITMKHLILLLIQHLE